MCEYKDAERLMDGSTDGERKESRRWMKDVEGREDWLMDRVEKKNTKKFDKKSSFLIFSFSVRLFAYGMIKLTTYLYVVCIVYIHMYIILVYKHFYRLDYF